MYNKVDVTNTVGMDEPTDEMGYHGIDRWRREQVTLVDISIDEFITCLSKDQTIMN